MSAVSLTQYGPATASLFNNMKTPASILGGAMVGMGFLAPLPGPPKGTEEEPNFNKNLRKAFHLIASASFCSELIAVMWATVAVNQLTERVIDPAESVWHLLQRDFDLEWAAVNAHFILGMFGFMSMVGIRVYLQGVELGMSSAACASVAGVVGAGLLLMTAIVNRGVAAGGGNGMRYGGTVVSLVTRYASLLMKRATALDTFGPLEIISVILAVACTCVGVKEMWTISKPKEKEH